MLVVGKSWNAGAALLCRCGFDSFSGVAGLVQAESIKRVNRMLNIGIILFIFFDWFKYGKGV